MSDNAMKMEMDPPSGKSRVVLGPEKHHVSQPFDYVEHTLTRDVLNGDEVPDVFDLSKVVRFARHCVEEDGGNWWVKTEMIEARWAAYHRARAALEINDLDLTIDHIREFWSV